MQIWVWKLLLANLLLETCFALLLLQSMVLLAACSLLGVAAFSHEKNGRVVGLSVQTMEGSMPIQLTAPTPIPTLNIKTKCKEFLDSRFCCVGGIEWSSKDGSAKSFCLSKKADKNKTHTTKTNKLNNYLWQSEMVWSEWVAKLDTISWTICFFVAITLHGDAAMQFFKPLTPPLGHVNRLQQAARKCSMVSMVTLLWNPPENEHGTSFTWKSSLWKRQSFKSPWLWGAKNLLDVFRGPSALADLSPLVRFGSPSWVPRII